MLCALNFLNYGRMKKIYNVIIPLGGKGQRFKNLNYNQYKSFLKVPEETIIEKICFNFPLKKTKFYLIGTKENLSYFKKKKIKKIKFEFINIKPHNKGPLFSIYLGAKKKHLNGLKTFIVYSDIVWKWNFKKIKKATNKKKIIVFTHKKFHPHLYKNYNSDFCKTKKTTVMEMSAKKPFTKDPFNEDLAIGCYYFDKSINWSFFVKEIYKIKRNKNIANELYLLHLINNLIYHKLNVYTYKCKYFVHLGIPDQLIDYLYWKNYFSQDTKKNIYKNLFENTTNLMLMAGKGSRMEANQTSKPLIKIDNLKMYEKVFSYFPSDKKIVITNSKIAKSISKKVQVFNIKSSASFYDTLVKSKKYLINNNNYFLLSCDCFAHIDFLKFRNFLDINKPDIVVFYFEFSLFQKKLNNQHTQLSILNSRIREFLVKKKYNPKLYGHAGFFWIANGKIFKKINELKKISFSREIIIDDYIKYLNEKSNFKISAFKVENYMHLGSKYELKEYNYWKKIFKIS